MTLDSGDTAVPSNDPVTILETERLVVRQLSFDDAAFVVTLFNDPAFLRFIGDKNVRTIESARQYLADGPMASYRRHGFGHYLVELRRSREPIGICSLVKREWLAEVDLGFAYLPAFRRAGYAFEAAAAVLAYARGTLGLTRLVAITSRDNEASIGLLAKLGFTFERMIRASEGAEELRLFASGA